MAERRMFSKTIIDSDMFLDMPLSAQALYFHLSMRADDDGFVNNPKKIQRMIGASDDDCRILLAKRFILSFESGIIVIRHWKLHNYIQKDRKKPTIYTNELSLITASKTGEYVEKTNEIETAEPELIPQKEMSESRLKRIEEKKNSSLPYSFEYKIRSAFVGKKCPICGSVMNYENNLCKPTIQHNVPISLGGKHEITNISVICASCNTSIQNRKITEPYNTEEVIKTWERIGNGSGLDTQVSIGKVSIGKDSLGKASTEDEAQAEPALDAFTVQSKEVLEYLNEKAGKRYKDVERNLRHIRARLREGFTVDDCKSVIDKKCAEWAENERMNQYLRCETLFGGKFESYLNSGQDKPEDKGFWDVPEGDVNLNLW